MAKMFLDPQILECDIESTEVSGFFGSGDTVDTGDWTITLEYRNHNTGSHSEMAIKGVHSGSHTGSSLTMNIMMKKGTGYVFDSVCDNGGNLVSNVTDWGFSITRNNFFNASDKFEFNIQIKVKNTDTNNIGAIGTTGVFRLCDFICVSIRES